MPINGTRITPNESRLTPIKLIRRIPIRVPSAPEGIDAMANAIAVVPFTSPIKEVPYPRRNSNRFNKTVTKPK